MHVNDVNIHDQTCNKLLAWSISVSRCLQPYAYKKIVTGLSDKKMKEGTHYVKKENISLKDCIIRCDGSRDMPNPQKKPCIAFDFVLNNATSTIGLCKMYTIATAIERSTNRLYRAGVCSFSKYHGFFFLFEFYEFLSSQL